MFDIPWFYKAGIALLLLVMSYGTGYIKGKIAEQLAQQEAFVTEMLRRQVIVKTEVTKYVEKIKLVNRDVPTVTSRVVSLCDKLPDRVRRDSGQPAEAHAQDPGTSLGDTGGHSLEALAAEDAPVVDAVDQCDSLINIVTRIKAHGRGS